MTTVAYDGITLAADTHSETSISMTTHKLHRLASGDLFAAAGSVQEILTVLCWLNGGEKPANLDNFEGLIITRHGAERLGERLMRVPVLEPFCAIGSGAHFALAAMDCGRNAAAAVRVAAKFDPGTRGKIDTLKRGK